jgi:hypothetical protein
MERDEEPIELSAELKRIYRDDASVPVEIDRAILNRARVDLARRGRLRWLVRGGGIAAAIVILVISLSPLIRPAHRAVAMQPLRGDVNGDGVVDIRDALLLARSIEANQAKPADDLNGDKIVDRRDVDAVAMLAVRIDGGAVQ